MSRAPSNRRPLLGRLALAGLVFAAPGAAVGAQSLATPSAHWGAHLLPDLSDRNDFALSFLNFTQYGKEVRTVAGVREYWFTPYNEIDETLGFNLLSYSRTRNGVGLGHGGRHVDPGPIASRSTVMLGFVNDVVPEFLQNEVIHRSNLGRKIERVPRRTSDTFDDISHGPSYYWPLVVGWSQEYFVRTYVNRRVDGREQRIPTPLFAGGGWQLGTLNQELFLHAGSNVVEVDIPDCFQFGFLRSVGIGGMARAGLLAPGHYFKDLTSTYANVQGVLRANIEVLGFAAQFDYTMTGADGFFVKRRTREQQAMIDEFDPQSDPLSHFGAKSPMSERFRSFRIRVGDFTFEMYNDSFGGKDKGPSFGTYASFNLWKPNRRVPVLDRAFDVFGR